MRKTLSVFSLEQFEKQCVHFKDEGYSPGHFSTCIKQCWQNKCHVCQAVEEIKRLRATIRRYRAAAKQCGTVVYMAEHPEQTEADHEPFE